MKRIFWTILALTIVSASTASAAGSRSTSPANILFINYGNTGIVTVYVSITPGTDVPITNIPACVSPNNIGNTYDYVFDATTAAGKTLLAGAIASHTAGINVWITGTG